VIHRNVIEIKEINKEIKKNLENYQERQGISNKMTVKNDKSKAK
jgi:hypothetical protein